ncbi:MAG: hypothetical protein ACXVBF_02780 [Flavisolibacter sp.]
MKKIVLTMLVFVVSLSLTGVAMAAAPKPPASFCLDTATGGVGTMGVLALVVKPSSTIKFLDGTQKFYSIQGALIDPSIYGPLVGSGYMEGNIFHFTFSTTYFYSGYTDFWQMEGFWDVIAHTGTLYGYQSFGGASFSYTFSLTQVPCTNYQILSEGSEPEGSDVLLHK